MSTMFKGVFVALVTPFRDGRIDEKALRDLIEELIGHGIDGLVPAGTTGESATLSHEEHKQLISIVVDAAKKRVPVLAGTGSNNTAESLDLTQYAKEAGADAAMLITPYYNKPTAQGLILHYEAIAKNVDIPIVLYNVPGRTSLCMSPETVATLAKIDNIVAVKEASGDLDLVSQMIAASGLTVLSGDDVLTLPILSIGGTGVISVVGNIAPQKMVALVEAFEQGDLEKAKKMHYELLPLCKAMFMETNPIPVKTSLKLLGKINGEFRLPLCDMQDSNVPKLEAALRAAGLLQGVAR